MMRYTGATLLIAALSAAHLTATAPAAADDTVVWDVGSEHVVDEASARFLCFLKPEQGQRSADDDETVIDFTEQMHRFMVTWQTDGLESAQQTDEFSTIKEILDEQSQHLEAEGIRRTTNCFRMIVLPGSTITPIAVVHRAVAPQVTVHALYAAIDGPPSPAGKQTVYGYMLTDWQERVQGDPAR